MTCLADYYDNVRNPIAELVDILAARHRLSVVQADSVFKVARDVRWAGGSRAAACEAARKVAESFRRVA